jgi:AcrR family transcriptional regulator
MPPKSRFTREEVVEAALSLTRAEGFDAVTARRVGASLNASTKVIFGLFRNMEELQGEVIQAADACYQRFLRREMESSAYPPYKASGMAYIRFAREETQLFRLLFMRDRAREQIAERPEDVKPLIALIRSSTGMSEADAWKFHLEMWIFVHGIAVMLVTGYLDWDWAHIDALLSDCYQGLKTRFSRGEVE